MTIVTGTSKLEVLWRRLRSKQRKWWPVFSQKKPATSSKLSPPTERQTPSRKKKTGSRSRSHCSSPRVKIENLLSTTSTKKQYKIKKIKRWNTRSEQPILTSSTYQTYKYRVWLGYLFCKKNWEVQDKGTGVSIDLREIHDDKLEKN